jgi:hypothetical protein
MLAATQRHGVGDAMWFWILSPGDGPPGVGNSGQPAAQTAAQTAAEPPRMHWRPRWKRPAALAF